MARSLRVLYRYDSLRQAGEMTSGGVWGRFAAPRSSFLAVVAGEARNHHQKKGFLGGLAALQTSLSNSF
jgi:hypothetical protein